MNELNFFSLKNRDLSPKVYPIVFLPAQGPNPPLYREIWLPSFRTLDLAASIHRNAMAADHPYHVVLILLGMCQ